MRYKAAVLAAKENTPLPVLVSMTFEENGRAFTGCTVESFAITAGGARGGTAWASTAHWVRRRSIQWRSGCAPQPACRCSSNRNAGLPDPATGRYSIGPKEFCDELERFKALGISAVGGCCGTTPEYLALLAKTFKQDTPVHREPVRRSAVCTPIRTVEIDTVRVIGERIESHGKKAF